MALRKPNEIREEIAELLDEATSIANVAEDEGRELSDEEQTRWTEIMDEESGRIPRLETDLKTAEKRQEERARLLAMRSELDQPKPQAAQSSLVPAKPQDVARYAQPAMVAPRLKSFSPDVFGSRQEAAQAAYDSGMWFMALASRGNNERAMQHIQNLGWDIRNVQTEGTDTAGGHTVPDPLSAAIIDIRDSFGIARQLARVVPMTSDTLKIPKRTGGLTVQYPGEATAITASDKTWGAVSLTAVKRATLTKVSAELNADSIINIMDDLASEIGQALGEREDVEFIDGDGTSTYGNVTGIKTAIDAAGVKTADTGEDLWSELDLQEFHDTIGLLPERAHNANTAWLVSRAFFHQVMEKLSFAAGVATIQSFATGASRNMFFGYPVVFSDKMPTATAAATICAYLGDFNSAVVLGNRSGIEIGISSERYFEEDNLAIRATSRYDINVHGGGSSAVGEFVALKTAA